MCRWLILSMCPWSRNWRCICWRSLDHNLQSVCYLWILIRTRRVSVFIFNYFIPGHFGCVYAATLRDAAMKNPVAVAVKTIEGYFFVLYFNYFVLLIQPVFILCIYMSWVYLLNNNSIDFGVYPLWPKPGSAPFTIGGSDLYFWKTRWNSLCCE